MEYSSSSGESDGVSDWTSATGTNDGHACGSTTVGASATSGGRKGGNLGKSSLDSSFSDEEDPRRRGGQRGSPTSSSGSFSSLASRVRGTRTGGVRVVLRRDGRVEFPRLMRRAFPRVN